MLPIAWCACSNCSTRARSSPSPPLASPRPTSHWPGSRSRRERKINRARSSSVFIGASLAQRLYHSVRRGLASFLTTKQKKTRRLRVLRQFAVQPGAGVSPVPIGGGRRNAQNHGGFVESQAGEIAQFDESPRDGVQGGQ